MDRLESQTVHRANFSLMEQRSKGVKLSHRKGLAEDLLTGNHVTNGGFEVELKSIPSGACTRTGASVSHVITEGQGRTYYLYTALRSEHFLFPLLSLQDASTETVSHRQQKQGLSKRL